MCNKKGFSKLQIGRSAGFELVADKNKSEKTFKPKIWGWGYRLYPRCTTSGQILNLKITIKFQPTKI